MIGVVTSPTGAVIRDILHRLADRFPRHVLVWPVRVQGEGAAEQVAAAIRGFNALGKVGPVPRPDLLIVARGGGSLEDLWAFNEEIVVRAAADSMIPLISAVGHETDTTLIDFVSDRRAPTPTAAAEMAVPVRAELMVQIDGLARRSFACWRRAMEGRRTELRSAARALPSADTLLAVPRQKLDALADRLPRALRANAQIHHTHYNRVAGRLTVQTLRARIEREDKQLTAMIARARHCVRVLKERRGEKFHVVAARLAASLRANVDAHRARIGRGRERTEALGERARRATQNLIERRGAMLERSAQLLNALSYHGVLARGFALVRDPEGRPVRQAALVAAGMRLDIEFSDGHVGAVAEAPGAVPAPSPPKPRARRDTSDPGQGSLFGS